MVVLLKVTYPDLPVSLRRKEILAAMAENQIVVVVGETGSGKTTQLPKMALENQSLQFSGKNHERDAHATKRGAQALRVGCTQPRRLAATSVARRVADELKVEVGQEVGYQVRFNEVCSQDTVVKFMTDGILLAETQGDRLLSQYGTIIIDEAHERSLNIDFLLGYLRRLVASGKRPDLRVLISSATLDSGRFSEFFGDCPVVEVEGRTFPVEDVFLPPYSDDESLREHVCRGVESLDQTGDALVFLPGEREIRECADLLEGRGFFNTEVVPVFARLSLPEQEKIFAPSSRRRLFLATNVAETSLTIPGIISVIDSGLARVSRFRPAQQVQSLQIEMISQASARQRRGRCGRVQEGTCIKLYSEEELDEATEYTDPEIRRSALSGVILRMLALGLGDIRDFPLLDPPNSRAITEGWKTLEEIGAVKKIKRADQKTQKEQKEQPLQWELTEVGHRLSRLAVDPRLGRMLIESEKRDVLPEVSIIVGALSVMDVRERPQEKAAKADAAHAPFLDKQSDFGVFLNIWREAMNFKNEKGRLQVNQLRKWCGKNFLNYRRIMEWERLVTELRRDLSRGGRAKSPKAHHGRDAQATEQATTTGTVTTAKESAQSGLHIYAEVHKSILSGIPRQVGVWDKPKRIYRGIGNRDFSVFPGSGLFKEQRADWVLGFELVDTSKLWARKVAEIDPSWLEEVVPGLCKRRHHSPTWDAQQGEVYGKEDITLGGLVVVKDRRISYARVDPHTAHQVFIREALLGGKMRGKSPVATRLRQVKSEIESAERKLRRNGYLWHEETAYEFFITRIPGEVLSITSYLKWLEQEEHKEATDNALVTFGDLIWEEGLADELTHWPDQITHAGKHWRVRYISDPEAPDDGVTFEVKIGQLAHFPTHLVSWGVRGMWAERCEALLRSLGKDWRKMCQPIAETAQEFIDVWWDWEPDGEMDHVLLDWLRERTGIPLFGGDGFDYQRIPAHLIPRLRILDDKGRVLLFGDQPSGMKESLAGTLRQRREHAANEEWAMTGGNYWCFDEVPTLAKSAGGGDIYPALVDEIPDSMSTPDAPYTVGLRAFLDPEEAEESHRAGVVRLFLLEHDEQARSLLRDFPMGTNGRLLLPLLAKETLPDLIRCAAEGALLQVGPMPRDEAEFAHSAKEARGHWHACAHALGQLFDDIATSDARIRDWMGRRRDGRHLGAIVEQLEDQRNWLFRPNFVWKTGYPRLTRTLRYFYGMEERLRRLKEQPLLRDEEKQDRFLPLWHDWLDQWTHTPEAVKYWKIGWMLEEWRLDIFAPSIPREEKVSAKKISTLLESYQ